MSLGEGVFPTGRRHALYLRGRSLKKVCHYWKGYVLVEGVSWKEVFPFERGVCPSKRRGMWYVPVGGGIPFGEGCVLWEQV